MLLSQVDATLSRPALHLECSVRSLALAVSEPADLSNVLKELVQKEKPG